MKKFSKIMAGVCIYKKVAQNQVNKKDNSIDLVEGNGKAAAGGELERNTRRHDGNIVAGKHGGNSPQKHNHGCRAGGITQGTP